MRAAPGPPARRIATAPGFTALTLSLSQGHRPALPRKRQGKRSAPRRNRGAPSEENEPRRAGRRRGRSSAGSVPVDRHRRSQPPSRSANRFARRVGLGPLPPGRVAGPRMRAARRASALREPRPHRKPLRGWPQDRWALGPSEVQGSIPATRASSGRI